MSTKHRFARFTLILAVAVFVGLPSASVADSPIHWDLTEIYISDEAWDDALQDLASKETLLDQYKGRLGSGASVLREALEQMHTLQQQAASLSAYASMRGDEDLRESGPQGMLQSLQNVMAGIQAATAWIDPEILEIPPKKLAGFLKKDKDLQVYGRYLERLEAQRPHVLDAESEELLGHMSRIEGVGYTVGGLLRNAEIPWPTITLADGEELRMDPSGFSKGRRLDNREDRIASYKAFYDTLQAFKGTLAATISATVQEHVVNATVRDYESSLEASLAGNEVDTDVYHMLLEEVGANVATLQRYLRLRGEILGIDDLRYHDSYPPLVQNVSADYSWENSKKLVLQALAPLGEEYVQRMNESFEKGWIDVYPRTGKRSGAYVNDAAYNVHPYMLLNHLDDYLGATTLAHEGGHLMHSWYAQEAQPYSTSNYAIFVAEVASTVNEVLFFRYLVSQAPDDESRLALLGNFLEGLRTTVFRQTMFAEFELAIHEMAERGEPLTGDGLNELYLGMLRRYQGHDEGAMTIDELYAAEWSYIPHFHYNFYVYQYATSYIAAIALAEGILEKQDGAVERYLDFLRAGSTKAPVQLLADAGVDMTKPEPIHAAMRLMNDVMDQIEEILERR